MREEKRDGKHLVCFSSEDNRKQKNPKDSERINSGSPLVYSENYQLAHL